MEKLNIRYLCQTIGNLETERRMHEAGWRSINVRKDRVLYTELHGIDSRNNQKTMNKDELHYTWDEARLHWFWWEKLDLNQRRPKPTDLQSAPFDRALAFSHIGGFSRNRTWDAQIFSLPLYQLS